MIINNIEITCFDIAIILLGYSFTLVYSDILVEIIVARVGKRKSRKPL